MSGSISVACAAVKAALADRYPSAQPLLDINLGAVIDQSGLVTGGHRREVGIVLIGEGNKRLEIRGNGFAYHNGPGFNGTWGAGYGGWEENRDEARAAWRAYASHFPHSRVSRLGVRYVNQLDLPLPADIDTYLLTGPRVDSTLPQTLVALGLQIGLAISESRQAFIREAIIPTAKPNHVGLALDIDVFDLAPAGKTDDTVWTELDALHAVENNVFEACITDKTRGLFE